MTKDIIKKIITKLEPSATLAINEKSKKLIAQGKKIYRFGFGQSPFPVPEKIGNVVSQLHIHVIARSKKDSTWPLSVWVVKKKNYSKIALEKTIFKIKKAFKVK